MTLRDLGIQTAMQTLAKPGQLKLSTKESNDSRIFTMTRFIIECVNVRAKKENKFFRDVIFISYAPKIERFFKIAVALMNRFSPPLFEDNSLHLELANRALVRKKLANTLMQKIKRHQWDKTTVGWTSVGESDYDFPILFLSIKTKPNQE